MKPKVLLAHPSFFVYGGAERQIAYLANELAQLNYNITIMTTKMCPDMRKGLKETRYVVIPNNQVYTEFIRKMLKRFDIYNPHNHPAELLHIPQQFPTLWQCNEPPEEVLRGKSIRPEDRYLVREYVDKAMVISDFEYKRFQQVYGFKPILNYPGVKAEFFSEELNYIKNSINDRDLEGYKILLEPGYITWTKNQVKAVQILAEVKKEYPKSVLVLAGHDKDPYANEVKAEAERLNITKDVIITGYIESDNEFRDLYNMADVCIAPLESQGGWASTFESICTGTPTIVSDKFVGANLMKKHNLGTVCSIDDMGSEVLKALAHEGCAKGSKWIAKNLTWKKFADKYDQVMCDML